MRDDEGDADPAILRVRNTAIRRSRSKDARILRTVQTQKFNRCDPTERAVTLSVTLCRARSAGACPMSPIITHYHPLSPTATHCRPRLHTDIEPRPPDCPFFDPFRLAS